MTTPEELRELDRRIAEAKGWLPGQDYGPPRRYSTSIEAAWELVEEMLADYAEFSFGHDDVAVIYARPDAAKEYHTFSRPDAEAISRAWLAWKEAQE